MCVRVYSHLISKYKELKTQIHIYEEKSVDLHSYTETRIVTAATSFFPVRRVTEWRFKSNKTLFWT